MADPDSGTTDKESWAGVSMKDAVRRWNPPAHWWKNAGNDSFDPDITLAADEWMDILCKHAVIPYGKRGNRIVLAASRYMDALHVANILGIVHRVEDVVLVERTQLTHHLLKQRLIPPHRPVFPFG
jgi:hypothetical protein